jgi:hypothetical protein
MWAYEITLLSVCVSPHTNSWIPEPIFMKLGIFHGAWARISDALLSPKRIGYTDASQNCPQATKFSYIKQYSNQSGLNGIQL